MQASRHPLSDGRWHFQHGPIDLVIQVDGDPVPCKQAWSAAWTRFATVLPELVDELKMLRSPVAGLNDWQPKGPVAQRMLQATLDMAWATPDGFVTPMAAVAGAVAQEIVRVLAAHEVRRACVNNGGDIAMHLREGESWRVGLVSDMAAALAQDVQTELISDGQWLVSHDMPVRGIATSGWGGRSFSFGVADSVTVLAATAAEADVAATLIANRVNLDHPGIVRRPANSLRDDTDLGDRLVTVDVPRLPTALIPGALQLGLDCARAMQARGQLHAAILCCQGQVVLAQPLECLV